MRPPGETGPQAARWKNGKEMNSVAIYSFNISNVSRSTGASTCATLAYISGEKIKDERTGKIYNYSHKDRVESVSVFLPKDVNPEYQDPEKLMNQIEKIEKAENARTGKKIIVALPREFDKTQRDEVLKNFIKKEITDRDFGCVVAVHNDLENHNPHAHILIPNRIFKDGEFASTKRKSQYALDENGNKIPVIDPETGKQKIGERGRKIWLREFKDKNALDDKNTLSQMRESWEEVCNKELSEENQIDHRSYKEREIEKEGTVHEGYAARKREKLGLISDRCEMNREILRVRNEYETAKKEADDLNEEMEAAFKELEVLLKKEKEQAAMLAQQEMLARQAAAEEKEKEEKRKAILENDRKAKEIIDKTEKKVAQYLDEFGGKVGFLGQMQIGIFGNVSKEKREREKERVQIFNAPEEQKKMLREAVDEIRAAGAKEIREICEFEPTETDALKRLKLAEKRKEMREKEKAVAAEAERQKEREKLEKWERNRKLDEKLDGELEINDKKYKFEYLEKEGYWRDFYRDLWQKYENAENAELKKQYGNQIIESARHDRYFREIQSKPEHATPIRSTERTDERKTQKKKNRGMER